MNIKAMTLLIPRTSKLAFLLACVLITGIGAVAKMAVDQVISIHEDIQADLSEPSQFYLWREWHRMHDAVIQTPSTPAPTLLLPTNPAVPLLQ